MKEKDPAEVRERIEKMIKEAKSVVEEARATARELKRSARREMREERRRQLRADRKKEKVLNLRIGEELEHKLREESDRLRVPVSSLVRNILDNALNLVDEITQNVGDLVDDVVQDAGGVKETFKTAVKDVLGACEPGECTDEKSAETSTEKTAANPIDDVSDWREVTLGKPADCAGCSTAIPRWYKANAGESKAAGKTVYLCEPCMTKMRSA